MCRQDNQRLVVRVQKLSLMEVSLFVKNANGFQVLKSLLSMNTKQNGTSKIATNGYGLAKLANVVV